MHHIDPVMREVGGRELVISDGTDSSGEYSIGVYTASDLPKTAFKLHPTSDQTLSSGSPAVLTLGGKSHDVGEVVDLANNKFVAPSDGYYQFTIQVRMLPPGSSGGKFRGELQDSSGSRYGFDEQTIGTAEGISSGFTVSQYLTRGDEVIPYVYQNTGADQTIDGEERWTWFEGYRIW
jgi:hypothetical protein